jgi:hypothetical protein
MAAILFFRPLLQQVVAKEAHKTHRNQMVKVELVARAVVKDLVEELTLLDQALQIKVTRVLLAIQT